jgi:putative ABC transport system permease protein
MSFSVQTSKRLNEVIQTVLRVLKAALGGIAAVALLVGGVGLMNTMYMAVLERTREIGIFLSLGAKRGQILALFLLEAGLLGLMGGLGGVGLGTGLAASIALLIVQATDAPFFTPMVGPSLIGLSLIFSTGLGMLAGFFPARRAASLRPVDALRYE